MSDSEETKNISFPTENISMIHFGPALDAQLEVWRQKKLQAKVDAVERLLTIAADRISALEALCRHVYAVLSDVVTCEEDGRLYVEDQPVPEFNELFVLLRDAIGEAP